MWEDRRVTTVVKIWQPAGPGEYWLQRAFDRAIADGREMPVHIEGAPDDCHITARLMSAEVAPDHSGAWIEIQLPELPPCVPLRDDLRGLSAQPNWLPE